MIESGDLSRPVRLQVLDGYGRRWWRPWRLEPVYRTVFVGYISRVTQDMRYGVSFELEDAMTRLGRAVMGGEQ